MRSTGGIQFFVCRSRIFPEPPFPSQGIAGSGNEIGQSLESNSPLLSNRSSKPLHGLRQSKTSRPRDFTQPRRKIAPFVIFILILLIL